MTIHAISGYLILVPLTFRFFWRFMGPKYSKFKDFPLSIKKAKEFAINILDMEQKYIGHNPIASFVMITILLIVPFIIFTGAMAYGSEESKGLFSSLLEMDIFEDIHELLANFLYLLLFLHLGGIFFERLIHKEHGTLNSIFKGYKNTKNAEDIKLNIFQKLISFFFFFLFFLFTNYLIFTNTNIFIY
jgi:cytochrome b